MCSSDLPWWADDCEFYTFPSTLLARGVEQVRTRHLERFKESNLQATLVNRIVVDNLVVDQELVTRTFPEGAGEIDVVAIYLIENGKIAKAWYRMGTPRIA